MASTSNRDYTTSLMEAQRKYRSCPRVRQPIPEDQEFDALLKDDTTLTAAHIRRHTAISGSSCDLPNLQDDRTLDGSVMEKTSHGFPHHYHHVNNLDLMDFGRRRRSRMSFVSPDADAGRLFGRSSQLEEEEEAAIDAPPRINVITDYGTLLGVHADDVVDDDIVDDEDHWNGHHQELMQRHRRHSHTCPDNRPFNTLRQGFGEIMDQIPAIVVMLLLILMVSIPFGAAYFPVKWSNEHIDAEDTNDEADGDDIRGEFPLPGRESLGIRMALFATFVG